MGKRIISLIMALLILVSIGNVGVSIQAASMPSCKSLKVSSITSKSARVDFNISNPSNLKIKTCGMQIRKWGGSWSTISETVNSAYQKSAKIPVWYTIGSGKEFNIKLYANTNYEYRGFCKYSGNTYYSTTKSFKTLSTTIMPSCNALKVSKITTSSARVDFNISNPSNLLVKTCGMQLRKCGSSWLTISETVNSSYQKSANIPVWYTIGSGKEFNVSLSANTIYEYRGFCQYNGNIYYTSISSFKTNTKVSTPAPKPAPKPSPKPAPVQSPVKSLPAAKLKALKKKYPEGSKSQNCYKYSAKAFKFVYSRNGIRKKKNLNGTNAWNNIKVGDMVHYYKSNKDSDRKYGAEHWVFVTAKNGNTITVAEGGYLGKVHYGRTIKKSKFTKGKYYNIEIRR
ncbi:MAG: hypothetical protein IJ077_03665 [Eubacterium sp.]|nr:hypothetical protein [Eubacterium sp.]